MKTLQVHDDAHQAVKVEAAKCGDSLSSAASKLIRMAIKLVQEGKISLTEAEEENSNVKEVVS